jgi:Flp pilus assembly protein TadD
LNLLVREAASRTCFVFARMTIKRLLHIYVVLVTCGAMTRSQDYTPSSRDAMRADPNNASIAGRVVLPSGSSADFNVKITLRNTRSPLATIYSDKHGEFRFMNLGEGTYYIDVLGDPEHYEPVTQQVQLVRGQQVHLTISLQSKHEVITRKLTKTVPASELYRKIPTAAKREYEKATRLIGKGKIEEAIEHFKQAIAIWPEYHAARNDLGVQYLKLGHFDEAIEQFQIVVETDPKYFNSRLNLGLALIEQRRYGEAIEQLNQAISIDSTSPTAHLWLGVALLQVGELQMAERKLIKALVIGGPGNSIAHYYLAHLYLKRGSCEEAMRELKIYLQESPRGEYAAQAQLLLERLKSSK